MGHDEWTERLWHLAADIETGIAKIPKILVDGPFGAPAINVHDYEHILMVTGGIGVTPIIAELESIMDDWDRGNQYYKSVTVIWTVRDPLCLDWFSNSIAKARQHSSGIFNIRLFATSVKEANPDTIEGPNGKNKAGPYRTKPDTSRDGPYRDNIRARPQIFGRIVSDLRSSVNSESSFGRGGSNLGSFVSSASARMLDSQLSALVSNGEGGGNLDIEFVEAGLKVEKVKGINIPHFDKGRPNMDKELDKVLERACEGREGKKVRLSVFICGPPLLVEQVEEMTGPDKINQRKSLKGALLEVHLHQETFDF